jgi:UDP-glucose 4-epimerase
MAAVVGVFRVLENQIKVLSVNISATEKLLQAAYSGRWNPQIVIASSSEVYGHGLHCKRFFDYRADFEIERNDTDERRKYTIKEFKEDMEPMVGSSAIPRWNYSISKLADETFGLSFARMYNMHVIIIRLFNTIGPRQTGRYGMVVPRFVKQALSGSPLTVFGDGLQMRSFCDVRDTVVALDLLANNPESKGQIVNVGNDREITIKELAEMVKKRAGSDSPIEYIPYDKAYGDYFEETYRRRPNLEKLYRLTNFKHKWTLEDTLDDLIARAKNGKLLKA